MNKRKPYHIWRNPVRKKHQTARTLFPIIVTNTLIKSQQEFLMANQTSPTTSAAFVSILILLATSLHFTKATCGPTCGDWCNVMGNTDDTNCFHPNPEGAIGCSDDFCCLTCDWYLRFMIDPNPHCSCEEFGGKCFASNCVPCAPECLPGFLANEPGPLGTGLLCVEGKEGAGDCEPCCQNSHEDGCRLECPCHNPAADCGRETAGSTLDFTLKATMA